VDVSRVFVSGLGAVSPAGWGVAALGEALDKDEPIPAKSLPRPGWAKPLQVRPVPAPPCRPDFLAHPRLRRTGAMAQHAVAAALEALGGCGAPARVGVVVAMLAGVVTYTRRFYEEVLSNPATASPLIFPETVFNAPASHLAAYLGSTAPNCTLVGDEGMFLQGLALAAEWLEEEEVEACVVIGVEELDWLVPDALRLFSRQAVYSSGAGALYLTRNSQGARAELAAVTDSFSMTLAQSRAEAARKARSQLPPQAPGELLCASARNLSRGDAAENAAWQDWTGSRVRPKAILGEAFAASAAWQCVAACDAIGRHGFAAANVSVVGANQQAIGARFTIHNS
jgi:3-oxoacyl-(acyl-carrier-protein) synthase